MGARAHLTSDGEQGWGLRSQGLTALLGPNQSLQASDVRKGCQLQAQGDSGVYLGGRVEGGVGAHGKSSVPSTNCVLCIR